MQSLPALAARYPRPHTHPSKQGEKEGTKGHHGQQHAHREHGLERPPPPGTPGLLEQVPCLKWMNRCVQTSHVLPPFFNYNTRPCLLYPTTNAKTHTHLFSYNTRPYVPPPTNTNTQKQTK